jgi:hypothetical protein
VHGSTLSPSACDAGPSPHQARPVDPILERPAPQVHHGLSIRQDGTTVLYAYQLLVARLYTLKAPKRVSQTSRLLLTPLSFSLLPVSTLSTRLPVAPAPAPRLTMDKPLTQMVAAAYHPVFLSRSRRHSYSIKFNRGTCIPACAFLISTQTFHLASADLSLQLPPTTSRVSVPCSEIPTPLP